MEFPCHGENGIEINRSDRPFFFKKKRKTTNFAVFVTKCRLKSYRSPIRVLGRRSAADKENYERTFGKDPINGATSATDWMIPLNENQIDTETKKISRFPRPSVSFSFLRWFHRLLPRIRFGVDHLRCFQSFHEILPSFSYFRRVFLLCFYHVLPSFPHFNEKQPDLFFSFQALIGIFTWLLLHFISFSLLNQIAVGLEDQTLESLINSRTSFVFLTRTRGAHVQIPFSTRILWLFHGYSQFFLRSFVRISWRRSVEAAVIDRFREKPQ